MVDIIPSPKRNIIFDSQLLTKIQKCPRDFNYTFNLDYVPIGGKSNALECGSIVHAILEHFNKARINGSNRKDAIEHGFNAGKEYLLPYNTSNKYITDAKHKGITNTPDESTDKPKRTGWKYVFNTMEQYFDYWRQENWTPISAEEVRTMKVYEDDEIRIAIKAKYDLIEDSPLGFINTDHKTMSQNRETISLNNQFMIQCIILHSRQVQINKIGWQKTLPAHEKFVRPMISYSVDRLAEMVNDTIPYYARMLTAYQDGEYWPANHYNCDDKFGWCTFKKVCEHDRNMRDEVLRREFEVGTPWDVQND